MSDYHYDQQPPVDRSLKVPHLVFGLLFLGFAGLWALGESGAISGEGVTILGPAVLILAGFVGLVASLASSRNRRHRDRVLLAEQGATTPTTTYDEPEAPASAQSEEEEEPTTFLGDE